MREEKQIKNSRIRNNRIRNNRRSFYPLITFFGTCGLLILVFFLYGINPFGTRSILQSDLKSQYAPFLVFGKNHLKNINLKDLVPSLFFSNTLGLGQNVAGTIGYYLLSPFNLLLLFAKDRDISSVITIIIMLKLSFASSFMCLFLERRTCDSYSNEKSFRERSKLPILFGIVYAFTAYATVFLFNIIWLDGYALLPLLLYFLEEYIFNQRYKGIVFSLILLFITNFYIAYMVGIASFIYLILREIEIYGNNKSDTDNKIHANVIRPIIKYVILAIICALICSVILIPVGLNILQYSDPTSVESQKVFTFNFLELAEQFFAGSHGDFSTLISNKPFIFASVLVTLATLIYFISGVFDKRIKVIRLCALLGTLFLMFVTRLDIICQAFDSPNWFQHRYSFVLYPCFFVISIEVLKNIRLISTKDILKSDIILIAVLILFKVCSIFQAEDKTILFNIAVVLIYGLILCLIKKNEWSADFKDIPVLLSPTLAVLVVVETSIINTTMINQSAYLSGLSNPYYSESIVAVETLGSKVNREFVDSAVNRCEFENSYGNDTLDFYHNVYAGVNGISVFNNSANRSMVHFLKQLGYNQNYSYAMLSYSYSVPLLDSFFSLKYLITENEYSMARLIGNEHVSVPSVKNPGESDTADYYLYRSDDVLPLAFPVSKDAVNFDFYKLENTVENKNYFEFQQEWYKSMFPDSFKGDKDCYTVLDGNFVSGPKVEQGISYIGESNGREAQVLDIYNDSMGKENTSEYVPYLTNYVPISDANPVLITYDVTMPQTGELYVNLSAARYIGKCKLYVNGEPCLDYASCFSQVNRLGLFEKGDIVTVEISADEAIAFEGIYFAVFDYDNFDEQFSRIDTSAVQINSYNDGHIIMTVDTSGICEQNSLILTSIPFDEGWSLYIDGEETDILKYQDALTAIPLNSDKNNVLDGQVHYIELKFVAPGLKLGLICTVIGILLISSLGIYDIKKLKDYHKPIQV